MTAGEWYGLDTLARAAPRLADPAVFVGRLLMAYIFIVEGYGKIFSYSDVAHYMEQYGTPSFLLPFVILTELGGGLLVAVGLLTRWAAIALAGFAVLTALIFHTSAEAGQAVEFGKDLALAGGFLILAVSGPGAWSLDGWLARRRRQGASPPRGRG